MPTSTTNHTTCNALYIVTSHKSTNNTSCNRTIIINN
uniref:Uncharacterized protein n=1 Tax=Siphoviridae sp. ctKcB20 TaxID=2827568 RepID=A0A8S5LKX4_9CAUD|nr:MAG TPA: hypothetical protein [Siphoviridae sp. ctKcB20]